MGHICCDRLGSRFLLQGNVWKSRQRPAGPLALHLCFGLDSVNQGPQSRKYSNACWLTTPPSPTGFNTSRVGYEFTSTTVTGRRMMRDENECLFYDCEENRYGLFSNMRHTKTHACGIPICGHTIRRAEPHRGAWAICSVIHARS